MSVIGPIVGKVTSTSARVLVDVPSGGRVKITAERDGAKVISETVVATKDAPVVSATLKPLTAGMRYRVRVSIDGKEIPQQGSVNTEHEHDTDWSFVVVSCNDIDYAPKLDSYTRLYNDHVRSTASAVLHIGDQVYADKVFRACVGALREVPKAKWSTHEAWVRTSYRQLYRDTWSRPGLRDILANSMNLMIWDDHEVVDDWADGDAFRQRDSPEHFVSRQAWHVYREYQRQLWDEGPLADVPANGGSEHHLHRFGDLGLMFLDCRGGRAYHQDTAKPYLGNAQWGAINAALSAKGTFGNAMVLVVACPVPLVFMGPRATENYTHDSGDVLGNSNDLLGHWSHEPYRTEQYDLLKKLSAWKAAKAGREVVLLGGDVHIGLAVDVFERRTGNYDDGEAPIFRQLVTSPLRRETHEGVKGKVYFRAIDSDRLLFRDMRPTYAFRIREHLFERNAGLVQIVRTKSGSNVKLGLISL